MSSAIKFLVPLLLTTALGGCLSQDNVKYANPNARTATVQPKPKQELQLSDHLIGVATLSNSDARLAGKCLDKNSVPYGMFEDVGTTGIVVKEADVERARRLIREDSWNHGYKLLVRINPTPKPDQVLPSIQPTKPIISSKTEPGKLVAKAMMKQVTVVAVADKDAKTALASLASEQIKAPGTWKSRGITGIVVAETDAKRALITIQNDAKAHRYNLLSTSTREPIAEPATDRPGSDPKDDDATAEGALIVYVTQPNAMKIAECLEGHSISSFSECSRNACGLFVSRHDADLALAYVQEDARTRGYTYATERVHYSGK